MTNIVIVLIIVPPPTFKKCTFTVGDLSKYAYHPFSVAPSRIKAPINPFTPFALSQRGIRSTIKDFAKSAKLAKHAGYDGVEIMGSEGYLINQFLAKRTNLRNDKWGGSFENRSRLPIEIIKS